MSMTLLIDQDNQLSNTYPFNAFPTTYIIDCDGNMVNIVYGEIDVTIIDKIVSYVDE